MLQFQLSGEYKRERRMDSSDKMLVFIIYILPVSVASGYIDI